MQRKVRDKKRTERQGFWNKLDAIDPYVQQMGAESPASTLAAGVCAGVCWLLLLVCICSCLSWLLDTAIERRGVI